jgi:hypothetical protein
MPAYTRPVSVADRGRAIASALRRGPRITITSGQSDAILQGIPSPHRIYAKQREGRWWIIDSRTGARRPLRSWSPSDLGCWRRRRRFEKRRARR